MHEGKKDKSYELLQTEWKTQKNYIKLSWALQYNMEKSNTGVFY